MFCELNRTERMERKMSEKLRWKSSKHTQNQPQSLIMLIYYSPPSAFTHTQALDEKTKEKQPYLPFHVP